MINNKEYEEMDMGDHVEAQAVLFQLEEHGCLSAKGIEFKNRYFKELKENKNLNGKTESLLLNEYDKDASSTKTESEVKHG